MITGSTVKNKLGIDVAISSNMTQAIERWTNLYAGGGDWIINDIRSIGLPAAIAGEIANLITLELKVKIEGANSRATYLQSQIDKVVPKLRTMIEYGNAKGGLILKPYQNGKEIDVDYVQAGNFLPVDFDANGNITSCVFVDQRTKGDKFYTRLEWHKFDSKLSQVTITNKAYKSTNQSDIGNEISLVDFEPWSGLQPETTLSNVKAPLYGFYRTPGANTVDTSSPLGMSSFASVEGEIKDADTQWWNLIWEFESGRKAIFADVMAYDRDEETGALKLPDKRLYRAVNNTSRNIGEDGFFHEFSPELREAAIKAGLNDILRMIEYKCGLAYGTISDPLTVDKTATEITSSKQRTFATVTSHQKALLTALQQLAYAMTVWASLYSLAPEGKHTLTCEFDDSIIVNKDVQKQQDLRDVQSGIMSKIEYRMRNYGEDEETARAKLAEVQAEKLQEQQNQPDPFNQGV